MELCDSAYDFVLKRGLERGPKRGQVMVAHHLPQAWLDIHSILLPTNVRNSGQI